jgi:hypothetical protein
MKKIISLALSTLVVCSCAYGSNLKWTSPPNILSTTNIDASEPQVAIDNAGNAVCAWIENNSVKSRSKLINGSWDSTVTLSGAGTVASSIKLVSDTNGNATAVWIESGVIKSASKTLAGNWNTATSLSLSGVTSPTLSVDGNGNVVAAWVRSGNIETSTKTFGSNWQSVTKINSTIAANPVIAVNGNATNSTVVMVWQALISGKKIISASTKSISGLWSIPTIISELEFHADKPFVAVDRNGNAIVVWFSYNMIGANFSNVVVKTSSRSATTGQWHSVKALSLPGIRNPATLQAQVAFDSIGNAIALWSNSFDDETFTLESSIKPVNGPWSSSVNLVDANSYAFAADLSATSFGDVLGLYMFYNGASLMIQSVESDANGFLNNFWSVPITISLGANNGYPKIAASLSGNQINAAAVWLSYNGTNNLLTSAIGSKTLLSPPSNLRVTQNLQNFGIFKNYYNTLTWNASIDSDVKGYLIFRNGVFLEEVDANVLSYIDNNRVQNGSVSYSVTAIDSGQTQSTTASVNFP